MSTIITLSISLSLTLSNKLPNLQETLLIASIFSPYLILYLQNVSKRKEIKNRLLYLYTRIYYLIYLIQMNAELAEKIQEYPHKRRFSIFIEEPEFKRFGKKVQSLVLELMVFNYNELLKFGCMPTDPENNGFILLGKYLLYIGGIQILEEKKDITTDKKAVEKITEELEKLII